jgi:hypothetical protein
MGKEGLAWVKKLKKSITLNSAMADNLFNLNIILVYLFLMPAEKI